MKAESFGFSVDKTIYYPRLKNDNKKRILFYARPTTERRAFELGLLALNDIHEKDKDIEIVFVGYDVSNYIIPFEHKNMGLLSGRELGEVYSQCDICIVISLSNLSLLPLEIMACNSVCATGAGPNNEWLLNVHNCILFQNNPIDISEKILYYLSDRDRLNDLRDEGIKLVENTSWEREAEKIKEIILAN